MNNWYSMDINKLEEILDTDSEEGLPPSSIDGRLEKSGRNQLEEGRKQTLIGRFIRQLKDPTIIVLIFAAVISLLIGEIKNLIMIFLIIIVDAVIGIVQEQKAEASLEAIKKMTSPRAKVIRGGKQELVEIEFLVPGDLVVLEAGDLVPADMRITKCYDLKVDEASLTGESIPVEKHRGLIKEDKRTFADYSNMVFMGSVVTYGRAVGIVTDTGMNTQLGKIAGMLEDTELEVTPLQAKLKELAKILGIISLSVCLIIFMIGIIQGNDTYEVFINAFSLAVASIPEGLPAIVTVVLALGMQVMAKEKAIMRNLPAVETSGAANVICSDKTGTLTQNKMTVTNIYVNGSCVSIEDADYDNLTFRKLGTFGVLCNDTTDGMGDPTEIALVNLAGKIGENPAGINKNYTRLHEIAFDSTRKLMTTVNEIDGEIISITKGAPEVLLSLCDTMEKDGIIEPIEKHDYKRIKKACENMSKKALRVLAIGYRPVKEEEIHGDMDSNTLENKMVFLGLYGMIDPPREDVKKSIKECSEAGIRTIMITGDHDITATAIAMELGIVEDASETITGSELEDLTDKQLDKKVKHYRVFARVSPEHKLRIVTALKRNGNVVVMTGDGVNDAPALKKADIGVAMGTTGTEVAKGAADMILADDDFGTIVSAVKYGRVVYDNIRKAVHFLLSGNFSEIVSIFLATMLGPWIFGMPVSLLSAVQILWINLVSDSLLAIALAFEAAESDIMKRQPRNMGASILGDNLGVKIIYQGLIIGIITFISYITGFRMGGNPEMAVKTGNTMAFMTLAFIQFFHVYNTRSLNNSVFKIGVFSNKYLNMAFVVNLLVQLMTMVVPMLRNEVFNLTMLDISQWAIVIGLSIMPVFIVEAEKFLTSRVKEFQAERSLRKPVRYFK